MADFACNVPADRLNAGGVRLLTPLRSLDFCWTVDSAPLELSSVQMDGSLSAGRHEARFDAASLPSGVYLYRLEAMGQALTGSALLMK